MAAETWEATISALDERVSKIEYVIHGNGEPSHGEMIRQNSRDLAAIKRWLYTLAVGIFGPLAWLGVSAILRAALSEAATK